MLAGISCCSRCQGSCALARLTTAAMSALRPQLPDSLRCAGLACIDAGPVCAGLLLGDPTALRHVPHAGCKSKAHLFSKENASRPKNFKKSDVG